MYNYQFESAGFWLAFAGATLLFQLYRGGLFFLAAFPGTLAHELAHYITALVLRGRPQAINLIPEKTASGWRLGSVAFYPNYLNGSFVALAPLLLLPLAWIAARHASSVGWRAQLWLGYIAGCAANSSLPSSADWQIVRDYPLGFFVLLLVAACIWKLHYAAGL